MRASNSASCNTSKLTESNMDTSPSIQLFYSWQKGIVILPCTKNCQTRNFATWVRCAWVVVLVCCLASGKLHFRGSWQSRMLRLYQLDRYLGYSCARRRFRRWIWGDLQGERWSISQSPSWKGLCFLFCFGIAISKEGSFCLSLAERIYIFIMLWAFGFWDLHCHRLWLALIRPWPKLETVFQFCALTQQSQGKRKGLGAQLTAWHVMCRLGSQSTGCLGASPTWLQTALPFYEILKDWSWLCVLCCEGLTFLWQLSSMTTVWPMP